MAQHGPAIAQVSNAVARGLGGVPDPNTFDDGGPDVQGGNDSNEVARQLLEQATENIGDVPQPPVQSSPGQRIQIPFGGNPYNYGFLPEPAHFANVPANFNDQGREEQIEYLRNLGIPEGAIEEILRRRFS